MRHTYHTKPIEYTYQFVLLKLLYYHIILPIISPKCFLPEKYHDSHGIVNDILKVDTMLHSIRSIILLMTL